MTCCRMRKGRKLLLRNDRYCEVWELSSFTLALPLAMLHLRFSFSLCDCGMYTDRFDSDNGDTANNVDGPGSGRSSSFQLVFFLVSPEPRGCWSTRRANECIFCVFLVDFFACWT